MKNIYNGKDTPPSDIYRYVDGEPKKIKRAWRGLSNSEYVKVWDLDGDYLSFAGTTQIWLEDRSTRWIAPWVYWVHKLEDGSEEQTKINIKDLKSFTIDGLTANYTTDENGNEYISAYALTQGDYFGTHFIRVSYVTPLGETLSGKYPIYHLREVSAEAENTTNNWYPFRGIWGESAETSIYVILTYQCRDENSELVSSTRRVRASLSNSNFTFPDVPNNNAQYRFGENQAIQDRFVSTQTYKIWTFTFYLNIREYTDERNPDKYKDIVPYSFVIDENLWDAWQYPAKIPHSAFTDFPEPTDTKKYIITTEISTSTAGNSSMRYAINKYNTLMKTDGTPEPSGQMTSGGSDFRDKQEFLEYLNTCMLDGEKILTSRSERASINISDMIPSGSYRSSTIATTFPFCDASQSRLPEMSSFGYIYWGDGTFDRFMLTDKILLSGNDEMYKYDETIVETITTMKHGSYLQGNNEELTLRVVNADNAYLRCGSEIGVAVQGEQYYNKLTPAFESTPVCPNRYKHRYFDSDGYPIFDAKEIKITSSLGYDIGNIQTSASYYYYQIGSGAGVTSYNFATVEDYLYASGQAVLGTDDRAFATGITENFSPNEILRADSDGYTYAKQLVTELVQGETFGYRKGYEITKEETTSADGILVKKVTVEPTESERHMSLNSIHVVGLPNLAKIHLNHKTRVPSLGVNFTYLPKLEAVSFDFDFGYNVEPIGAFKGKMDIYNPKYCNLLRQYYGEEEECYWYIKYDSDYWGELMDESCVDIIANYTKSVEETREDGTTYSKTYGSYTAWKNGAIRLEYYDGYTTVGAFNDTGVTEYWVPTQSGNTGGE